MTKTDGKADIYQTVTDGIVAAIEAGISDDSFELPWHRAGLDRPVNVESGKDYRGMNTLILWVASVQKGYTSNAWGTFRQWQEKGASVRKGERATAIMFWNVSTREEETDEGEVEETKRVFGRTYPVFNSAQVDGWPPPVSALVLNEGARIQAAEAFFKNVGACLIDGGDRAFYRPSTDEIGMPGFGKFRNAEGYYSTLAHEHCHWTGARGRLDREFGKRFGAEAYAMEELVAELGAAFLCSNLRIKTSLRDDHASYIAGWLRALKNDKRAIFTAAGAAQKAADFLNDLQPTATEVAA